MRRKWAYLGAALPLTTAVAAWAAAQDVQDETNKMPRSKNGPWQEQENEDSATTNDSPPEKEAPGIKAPPRDAYSDEGAYEAFESEIEVLSGLGTAGVQLSLPDSDGSMYGHSPLQSNSSLQFASAGGGSIAKVVLPNGSQEPEEPSDSDVVPTEQDPEPVIEPELSDTDAMLILLGGMAEAGGSNSTAEGEVVLDIVDYGAITIGYGYAKYLASGGGAHADTFVDVTGADLVFTYEAEDSDHCSASSNVYVIALDFEEGMDEQAAAGDLNWMELLAQGPFAQWAYQEDEGDPFLEGNFSMFKLLAQGSEDETPTGLEFATHSFEDAGSTALAVYDSERGDMSLHAEAQGYDTLTAAEGYLVIEDHFSSVGGTLIGIA